MAKSGKGILDSLFGGGKKKEPAKAPAKKAPKPDPKMLGTGAARKAAESLKGRSKQIEDALKGTGAEASRKRKDNGRRNA